MLYISMGTKNRSWKVQPGFVKDGGLNLDLTQSNWQNNPNLVTLLDFTN